MTPLQHFDPPASRHLWVRDVLWIVLVAAGLFGAGCASYTRTDNLALFLQKAPLPTLVPRNEVIVDAERAASVHEGDFVLRGSGHSMEPVYLAGTALVVHPTAMHMLRPGMAVVYRNGRGGTVAHMLLEKTERGWLAMGLNNVEPDSALVTEKNLVGIVRQAFAADDAVFPAGVASQIALKQALEHGAPMALLH